MSARRIGCPLGCPLEGPHDCRIPARRFAGDAHAESRLEIAQLIRVGQTRWEQIRDLGRAA